MALSSILRGNTILGYEVDSRSLGTSSFSALLQELGKDPSSEVAGGNIDVRLIETETKYIGRSEIR